MNVVILAGGAGTRLRPVLKDNESKPFVRVFNDGNILESITSRNVRLLKNVIRNVNVIISTEQEYFAEAQKQLGKDLNYCIEPEIRDTYAAVLLASAYLKSIGINQNEPVIIMPSDFYSEKCFFEMFINIQEVVKNDKCNIGLIGIKPVEPSDQYGYILKDKNGNSKFLEKPNIEKAKKLIEKGAFWNAGVFCFKLNYVLSKMIEEFGTCDYGWLLSNYSHIKKISFDKEVVIDETFIDFVIYNGQWKDIGQPETFNSL